MQHDPKHIELGWLARRAIRGLAPASIAESFAGDLLEEANQRVLPLLGERTARRWIAVQIVRSTPRLLSIPLFERGHFGMLRSIAMLLSAGATLMVFGSMGHPEPLGSVFKPFVIAFSMQRADLGPRAALLLIAHVMMFLTLTFGSRSSIGRVLFWPAVLIAPWGGSQLFFAQVRPVILLLGLLPMYLCVLLLRIEVKGRGAARDAGDSRPAA